MVDDPTHRLTQLAEGLRDCAARGHALEESVGLDALEGAASNVAKAWSGSNLGFHSRVYYDGLHPSPAGTRFSPEWGFEGVFQGTSGAWREYEADDVRAAIYAQAGDPDLREIEQVAEEGAQQLEDAKGEASSILYAFTGHHSDEYLDRMQEEIEGVQPLSARDAVKAQLPSGQIMTRDTTAASQGLQSAPHQDVIGRVVSIRSTFSQCEQLAKYLERTAAHFSRLEAYPRPTQEQKGTHVFIGHGRSLAWRELKDFIQDRLLLPWEEFNRVPVAGVTNIARLSEMLDNAGIAFLVLTAEDERNDGSVAARQNVVHEAGLFQGRLGFTRAIVVLEDGCEEFSNIHGLGQIRFPTGQISAAFEEVRRVLEREGFLVAPSTGN